MRRNASPLRLFLTLLLLAGLFFGAAGQSLASGGDAAPRAQATLQVIINEVAWGGTVAGSGEEWIELYNPGGSDVILSGWQLTSTGGLNIALSGTIIAGGYFLLERTDDNVVSDIIADQIHTGALGNGGESLSLIAPGFILIDTANQDGGIWPGGGTASLGYATMERISPTADSDSNWGSNDGATVNGSDANGNPLRGTPKQQNSIFVPGPPPTFTSTPSPTNTAIPSRAIIINEVAWMGTIAFAGDEWIELYNPPGGGAIDLTGWKLEALDGDPSISFGVNTTGSTIIQDGGYLILERGDGNVISDVAGTIYNSGPLTDSGETLRLLAPDRSIIDTANGNGGAWPAGTLTSASNHGTMDRISTGADSDSNWVTNDGDWIGHDAAGNQIHGTPGGTNVPATRTPTATVSPTFTSTSTPTNTSTPTSTNTPPKTVTITEVAWMGTQASSSDEWIELYNNTAIPINLSGWSLRATDGTPNISLSGSIASHDYFLLERTDNNTISDITADFIFTGEIGNSGEILSLYDPLGNKVDSANANGGSWPAGNSITSGSMERAGALLNDVDTSWFTHTGANPKWGKDANGNNIKGTPKHDNWAFGVTATATATQTPTPTGTLPPTSVPFKTVVISEVAWAGTAAYSGDEWIELFNNTTEPVNLNGWRLRSYRYSGSDFILNLNIALTGVIEPRGSEAQGDTSGYYLLEARTTSVNYPGGKDPAGQTYSGSLYNSGEILLLCSPYNLEVAHNCNINTKNQIVDYVNGSLNTNGSIKPWAAGSSSTYGSMERKNVLSDEETAYFTHTGLTPRAGQDANGNAIKGTPGHPNWAFTVTATPRITPTLTPTRTPTRRPAAAPILEINEFLARAGTDWNNDGKVDVYDEYIEVINYGTVSLNLSSYKLDDYEQDESGKVIANAFTLPSQTLKPGEIAVFYGSQTGIRLDDSGDTVRLLRASNGDVLDARTYPMVKSLDVSICRYKDGFVSWVMGCFPTPGLPNALTGSLPTSTSNGQPLHVCVLADSVPMEFVLAECGESGLGIWNSWYWDSLPGEGNQIWQSDERDKWIVIYQ